MGEGFSVGVSGGFVEVVEVAEMGLSLRLAFGGGFVGALGLCVLMTVRVGIVFGLRAGIAELEGGEL